MKLCNGCGTYKPHDMFSLNKKAKDGLYYYCKECKNIKHKSYMNKIKDLIYTKYGGYKCKCCGETEVSFLSIDHINNDGYKFRSEGKNKHSGTELYGWIIKNNYPEIFQILCHNCNLGRHINNGTCPHVAEKGI